MRKYIYMIDYEDKDGADQIECVNMDELLYHINLVKKEQWLVTNVKLVENENREVEEEISITLGKKIISKLGYKPRYMSCIRRRWTKNA